MSIDIVPSKTLTFDINFVAGGVAASAPAAAPAPAKMALNETFKADIACFLSALGASERAYAMARLCGSRKSLEDAFMADMAGFLSSLTKIDRGYIKARLTSQAAHTEATLVIGSAFDKDITALAAKSALSCDFKADMTVFLSSLDGTERRYLTARLHMCGARADAKGEKAIPADTIALRVVTMKGTTLDLPVSQRALVSDVKAAIAIAHEVHPHLIELFVQGVEDALPPDGRLDALGISHECVVFMLDRQGWWCWTDCGRSMKISREGMLVTQGSWWYDADHIRQQYREVGLVTGGEPMTEGTHYWELRIADDEDGECSIMIGVVRPGQHSLTREHEDACTGAAGAHYINAADGSLHTLHGPAEGLGESRQGRFRNGDRIGVLLDLAAGRMRFYRNGKRCGPGFGSGVTGPLVRAAQLRGKGSSVTALPGEHVAAPQLLRSGCRE